VRTGAVVSGKRKQAVTFYSWIETADQDGIDHNKGMQAVTFFLLSIIQGKWQETVCFSAFQQFTIYNVFLGKSQYRLPPY
jgi:uncharacterized protein YktA (UPF0223 family)